MSVIINIKKITKKGSLKKEKKVKKYIEEMIIKNELGSLDFVLRFVDISAIYNFKWANEEITSRNVIQDLIDKIYRFIQAEVDHKNETGSWSEGWVYNCISSGRISVIPVEFEKTNQGIYFEFEFFTSL